MTVQSPGFTQLITVQSGGFTQLMTVQSRGFTQLITVQSGGFTQLMTVQSPGCIMSQINESHKSFIILQTDKLRQFYCLFVGGNNELRHLAVVS